MPDKQSTFPSETSETALRESQVFKAGAIVPCSKNAMEIRSELDADPVNPDLWMRMGNEYAKLLFFREAIDCYSIGLTFNPFHALCLRYRGHRKLNIRQFAEGASDLETASRIEQNNWDIWYHLGLAYFLLGQHERAIIPYTKCLALTEDPTAMPAIIDWSWRNYMRAGLPEEAKKLTVLADPDLDAGENWHYQNLTLLYSGHKTAQDVLADLDDKDCHPVTLSTQGFGLANFFFLKGEHETANALLTRILREGYWPAFGCLAAEVDAKARGLIE